VYHEDDATFNEVDDHTYGDVTLSFWTEGYEPKSFSWYPWEHIVEPHKTTHIRPSNIDFHSEKAYTYEWKVEALCTSSRKAYGRDPTEDSHDDCGDMVGATPETVKGENGALYMNGTGPEFGVMFKKAATQYVLDLIVRENGKTIAHKTEGVPIMCKYVRREIRDLVDDDRERFLDALEIAHRMPLEEGHRTYGGKYMDAIGATRKHLARMTLDRCTPHHNGKVFFTAHAAYSLEMEQSLQLIDASIAMPYWDYTIDSKFYGSDWPSSKIWADDWFGASNVDSDSHVLETGRFAYLPIGTDKDAVERNGYGRITDKMNADPSHYVTRGAKNVCGIETKVGMPSCNSLHKALGSTTLEELDRNVEYDFHGYIHMLLGGAWDCKVSLDYSALQTELGSTVSDLIPQYVEDIALDLNVLWRYFFLSGYLKYPDGCAETDDFSTCRGSCPLIDNNMAHFSNDQIYMILDTGDILTALDGIVTSSNDNSSSDAMYLVDGLDYLGSIKFYKWLIPVLCGPGKLAAFASPLAATNDPIFWISHNSYERLWSWKRLHPDNAFKTLWNDNNSTCYGHNYHDLLPWKNFVGEDNVRDYSNEELVALFDPKNPKLPHVYDTFEWDHCAFDYKAHPTHRPTPQPTPLVHPTSKPTYAAARHFPKPTMGPKTPHPLPKPTHGIPPPDPPTVAPTPKPTKIRPTPQPTHPPVPKPTDHPVPFPTYQPTDMPVLPPTPEPTKFPLPYPTPEPTKHPLPVPTHEPTKAPLPYPTEEPTKAPIPSPTHKNTQSPYPIPSPTQKPSMMPVPEPTAPPTHKHTQSPYPIPSPTQKPSMMPVHAPTAEPTKNPLPYPTPEPTKAPLPYPTAEPTKHPVPVPTGRPTVFPTYMPTDGDMPIPRPTAPQTYTNPLPHPTAESTATHPLPHPTAASTAPADVVSPDAPSRQ
jgi:hypothetical protein